MIRKIDELGRIVLPAEMRAKLHLEKEDAVHIDCVDDKIILSKAKADYSGDVEHLSRYGMNTFVANG